MRFAHLSDLHISCTYEQEKINEMLEKGCRTADENLRLCLHHLQKQNIKNLLITGDLVHNGDVKEYEKLRSLLGEFLGFECLFCLGNHDRKDHFRQVFPLQREALFNDLPVFCLDSHKKNSIMGHLPDTELFQLERFLNHIQDACILAMHHPIYVGDHRHGLRYQTDNVEQLLSILKNSPVKGIFTGHIHHFTETKIANIPLYVGGSLSMRLHYSDHLKADNQCSYSICQYENFSLSVEHHYIPAPLITHIQDPRKNDANEQ